MNPKNFTFLLFLLFSSTLFSQDLDLQLAAYYDFESNTDDQTGNLNHLSVISGNEAYSDFNGGEAMLLDGNTTLKTILPFDVSDSDSFAISLVLKTSEVSNDLQTVLQGANIGFGIFVEANSGRLLTFLDKSSSDPVVSANSIADGEWHHVVLESKNMTTSLYIDGVLEGSRAEPLEVGDGGADNHIFIGRTNLGTRGFTGELDELRIYTRDLTPCDQIDLTLSYFEPEATFLFDAALTDESMNALDFAVTDGEVSYESFGPGDQAVVFDGNTRIATESSFDNSDFRNVTLSFWFKAAGATGERQVLIQGANMGSTVFLEDDGRLAISFDASSSNSFTTTFSVADDEWHHVTAMSTGDNSILLLDGQFQGLMAEDLFTGNGGADNKWYLGQTSLNLWSFTGAINNLVIYDHLLETCQIERIIERGPVSSTKNLTQTAPNFVVSPNPSSGDFILDFGKNSLPKSIQIFDLSGKMIFSDSEIVDSKYQFSIDRPTGVYILKTVSENRFSTVKLIKEQ